MTTLRALGFVAASTLMILTFAGPVQAALVHTLEISGTDVSGMGEIEVPTLTGNDPNDVISFSLSGEGPLGAYSFDESHIAEIDWSIDPDDWVLTFNQLTLSNTINAGGTGTCLLFPSGQCTATSSEGGSFSPIGANLEILAQCAGLADQDDCAQSAIPGFRLVTEPVHIPEPATLTLFVGGLAGLLGWAWRRRRSSARDNG